MDFAFNEDQEALRQSVRQLLASASPIKRVREVMATDAAYDRELYRRIASELGLTALLIPEEHGGAGFGYVELIAVMEEMGRALVCAPFFSTTVLATQAILLAAGEEQKSALLPGLAAGEVTAALAYTEPNGRWGAPGISATAARKGDDYIVSGTKTFVIDGHTADLILVAARAPGTAGEEGVSLFVVPSGAPRLERRLLPTMDSTRRLAEVRLDGVRLPASALLGDEGRAAGPLRRTLDLAAIALSAEQVGGADRCLEMAVDYAKVRMQFGRPIGSFQAIKHKCAEMLLRMESARSASYQAGWAAAAGDPDLSRLAALAKVYCSEAFFFCASENIQIHGGIGFTWEHDAHLYFKRARASESLFGSPSYHRERVAQAIGL